MIDTRDIEAQARKELLMEDYRVAIDAAKVRLRARMEMSWWRKLLDLLPFTLTWKGIP